MAESGKRTRSSRSRQQEDYVRLEGSKDLYLDHRPLWCICFKGRKRRAAEEQFLLRLSVQPLPLLCDTEAPPHEHVVASGSFPVFDELFELRFVRRLSLMLLSECYEMLLALLSLSGFSLLFSLSLHGLLRCSTQQVSSREE